MRNPFTRTSGVQPEQVSMRSGLLAQLLADGGQIRQVPPECIGIVIANDGSTTRHAAGQPMRSPWQKAFWVATTPQRCQLCLHPACPEIQLDLRYVLDSADPRLARQRFDLFLASEINQDWSCADMAAQLQTLLQAEMASGNLDCHPQMSLPEWMRFRAQLERWLYIRFGLTVEDCALVDAGETLDYAQILLARAVAVADTGASHDWTMVPPQAMASAAPLFSASTTVQTTAPTTVPTAPSIASSPASSTGSSPVLSTASSPASSTGSSTAPSTAQIAPPLASPDFAASPALPVRHADCADTDQFRLRRLFLEIPDFMVRWRALNPPAAFFAVQQTVLQRLSMLKMTVAAMPALTLAAPQQTLAPWQIDERRQAMQDAMHAWEQAWALLARLQPASPNASQTGNPPASQAGSPHAGQAGSLPARGLERSPGTEPDWQHDAGLDAVERIFANLEHALTRRAQVPQERV